MGLTRRKAMNSFSRRAAAKIYLSTSQQSSALGPTESWALQTTEQKPQPLYEMTRDPLCNSEYTWFASQRNS